MVKAEVPVSCTGHQCWFAQDVTKQVHIDPTPSGCTGLCPVNQMGLWAAFNSFTQQ